MGNIFICYRRDDSRDVSDRIFGELKRHFSRNRLFKDVNNIPPGVNFKTYIETELQKSAVMLAIIGPNWLSKNADGLRRLDDPADLVSIEISTALRLQIRIIPVLVGGAKMPTRDMLPTTLGSLADLHATTVRSDPDFDGDLIRLRAVLEPIVGRSHSLRFVLLAIAAIAFGVAAWLSLPVKRSEKPDHGNSTIIANPTATSTSPTAAAPVPASSPTTTADGCFDYLYTDTQKVPPVTTTKRICN